MWLLLGTSQTDNGGEYFSKEFDSYKRINKELSAPYLLAQNGVAERYNHTLMKSARTTIAQAVLPEHTYLGRSSSNCHLFVESSTNNISEKINPL